jgi:hypothetical protein
MTTSKWIWAANAGLPDEYADFKAEFEYNGGALSLEISADTDYAVYLNGNLVAFGQYPDYPDRKIYDTVDLTDKAKIGKNGLYIVGYHCGENFATHIKREAGIRFELVNGGEAIVVSNENIESRLDPYFVQHARKSVSPQLGFTFGVDLTASETEYAPSVITETASGEIYPRPIKKLDLCDRVPSKLVKSGTFTLNGGDRAAERMQNAILFEGDEGNDGEFYIFDLGGEQTGLCDMDFDLENGCRADIGWGEHLTDGRCRTAVRNFAVEIIGNKGRNHVVNPMRRFGGRYFQIFVYGKAKINYLGILPTPYPITEKPFSLENELDERIYKTCINTLRHCMHEHYEDCPWREQALYVLDSRNQMLCGYYVFEETDFAKASLQLITQGLRPDGILNLCYPSGQVIAIPSFSLAFFMQMREYLNYTGDIEFLREKYPMMKTLISTFLSKDRENGLIENFYGEGGYWNFYEWADTMEGRFNETVRSIEAPINAYLSLALSDFAYIAEKLGYDGDAKAYEAEKTALNRAIKNAFYNEKTGLFESFLDRHLGTYSVLTNALCLLCGAADEVNKNVIFEILANNGAGNTGLKVVPNTLSMNGFRFDALLEADETRFAPIILDEIRREYGKMLDCGATTFWETSLGEADFDNAGSLCHGWSALPAYYFHRLLK